MTDMTDMTAETPWERLNTLIAEYVDGYELCGDGAGDYKPRENEQVLIIDAIHGLLADDDFSNLYRQALSQPAEAEANRADAERLDFLQSLSNPQKYMVCVSTTAVRPSIRTAIDAARWQIDSAVKRLRDGGDV
jgi:hypothetical protein